MGEDFVSHRQQRTVEMVRMKNIREEKVLAMKLGDQGGLESLKRFELNRFRKEKQRLMRDLERMKSLKAKPKYSESLLPDILTVQKEVVGDEVGSEHMNEVDLKVGNGGNDNAKVNKGEVIAYYGLSPRQPSDMKTIRGKGKAKNK